MIGYIRYHAGGETSCSSANAAPPSTGDEMTRLTGLADESKAVLGRPHRSTPRAKTTADSRR